MYSRSDGVLVVGLGGPVRQFGHKHELVACHTGHVVGQRRPPIDQASLLHVDDGVHLAADEGRLDVELADVADGGLALSLRGGDCGTHHRMGSVRLGQLLSSILKVQLTTGILSG